MGAATCFHVALLENEKMKRRKTKNQQTFICWHRFAVVHHVSMTS
jgi:hypothetical protein